MRIRIFPTPRGAARALAADLARALRAAPGLVLGLPSGRTPIPLYDELAALCRAGRIDFSRAASFNLDEFLGIGPAHRSSYHAFMRRHLFAAVNLPRRRIHVLNGAVRDPAAECARYERAIARAGGIDLQLLGIGANGHIGFNEPGTALVARTHVARLTPATRRANAALFGGRAANVPRRALSMGMATILQARRIVLLATGRGKARAVARAIHGPITPRVPASFLQLHANVDVWLDRDAASLLEVQ
ncbi:MAG: glucosamine-6-phosphate deaminase [Betaproteobacteria bacterium]